MSSWTLNAETYCRGGADGKRAEGRVFVSFEVIGSIPISGTTITIVELDVKRSNPTPVWRREKRARLIT